MSRDIVVTIPRAKLREIEDEEAEVARMVADGITGVQFYWHMGRLPKEQPDRIYFVWDGAIRAYHEVLEMDEEIGRIYMDTTIHNLPEPIIMQGFRGYRYFMNL